MCVCCICESANLRTKASGFGESKAELGPGGAFQSLAETLFRAVKTSAWSSVEQCDVVEKKIGAETLSPGRAADATPSLARWTETSET